MNYSAMAGAGGALEGGMSFSFDDETNEFNGIWNANFSFGAGAGGWLTGGGGRSFVLGHTYWSDLW